VSALRRARVLWAGGESRTAVVSILPPNSPEYIDLVYASLARRYCRPDKRGCFPQAEIDGVLRDAKTAWGWCGIPLSKVLRFSFPGNRSHNIP